MDYGYWVLFTPIIISISLDYALIQIPIQVEYAMIVNTLALL